MTSKAFGLAQLGNVFDDGAFSNRNLLINSAMQVAQRGTSQTTSGYGSVDRWYIDNTANGGGQVADAPDDFEYSLKVNTNSGNAAVRQAIELPAAGKGGVFRSGQTFTLSFWLKSDNAGEAINIFIASSTSVFGTTTTHVNDTSTGLTTSTSWTRYTYTYTQASNVGGSDTCYNIVPYVSSPSGAIYITGVQLEVGDTATPFEHRSYGDELARCERYYQLSGGVGRTNSTTGADIYSVFKTPMRVTPSVTINDGTSSFAQLGRAQVNINSISLTFMQTSYSVGCVIVTSDTGLTAGLVAATYGTAFAFDAEL